MTGPKPTKVARFRKALLPRVTEVKGRIDEDAPIPKPKSQAESDQMIDELAADRAEQLQGLHDRLGKHPDAQARLKKSIAALRKEL